MARRDYRQRETKKSKKSDKKAAAPLGSAPLSVEVAIVPKKKRDREDTEE